MLSAGKDVEQLELSHMAGRNAKWRSQSGKQQGCFFPS